MIFVSSHRPFNEDPTQEYVRNQIFAFKSWLPIASVIVYFGAPEPQLQSSKTIFIEISERFPMLSEMVDFCADQKEWSCIINADIWVSPFMPKIEKRLLERHAACASSWRHEFDPAVGVETCERVDNGLDFFAATPASWDLIHQQDAMRVLRIGAGNWDSWMLGAFFKLFRHHFYDLTKYKMIRHPKHGGRNYGHIAEPPHFIGWPTMSQKEL